MGYRPRSRREALLEELCARGGYCNTGLTADDLTDDLDATQIAEMVLRGEGLDPVTEPSKRAGLMRAIDSWLVDPRGPGARSGLPR